MPIRERNQPDPSHDRARERAETMALLMVQFLLDDDERTDGLFDTTGLSPDDLRSGLTDAAFLGGVMDYLLGREDLLVVFCEEQNIDPTMPLRVRQVLP